MPNYRLYYNRTREFPWVWSIDEGTQATEINLTDVILHKVSRVETGGDPTAPRKSYDVPAVWINIYNAEMAVKDGVAHFFQDPYWRIPPIPKGDTDA